MGQPVLSNDRSIYAEQEMANVLAAHFPSVSATSSCVCSFHPHKIEQENSLISFFCTKHATYDSKISLYEINYCYLFISTTHPFGAQGAKFVIEERPLNPHAAKACAKKLSRTAPKLASSNFLVSTAFFGIQG